MKIKISTRLVLIFREKVIKLPISYRGYLQCKNEKKMWDKYKHTNFLGTLIYERFGIIIMKKYTSINRIPEYVVHKIKNIIPEFDIPNCDLYNYKNWGVNDSLDYVLIDYGINEKISKMYDKKSYKKNIKNH